MIEEQALRNIPRFAGLSPQARRGLAGLLVRQTFERGSLIFMEGSPCTLFHVVESGVVKVYTTLESGKELILGFIYPGEPLGEVALIDNIDLPGSAVAQDAVTLLTLSREEYFAHMERYPEIALAAIRDLSLRMRALRERVVELGDGGVESRLAHVLLALGDRIGTATHNSCRVPIQLSRQELAAMVGARIETVIRIMSRWQKEALVHTLPDGFLIQDTTALNLMRNSGG
jgi:CRP/FNR family transcriptional regulator